MSAHSTYETLRHIADSWGLLIMFLVFLAFIAWPFRPGAREQNDAAARMIFKDDGNGE